MNSVNLLPRNVKEKKYVEDNKKGVFVISFTMLSLSIFCYAIIFIFNMAIAGESKFIDTKLGELDDSIIDEIDKNKSELIKDSIKNASALLDNHSYYSNAMNEIQNIINKDIYLTNGKFSLDENKKRLTFKFQGYAKNASEALKQITVFKDNYWIDSIDITSINPKGNEEIVFDGTLFLKEDIILYHQEYWNRGLSILTSKTDRFLKIDYFTAELIEDKNGQKKVVANFKGYSYDSDRLEQFEDDLKSIKSFVTNAKISYDFKKDSSLDFYEFNGTMEYISYN